MEKKNKGLVVAIIILVVISLGLGGYICYEKGLFNKFLNKETPTTDTTDTTKEDKYTNFKVVRNYYWNDKEDKLGEDKFYIIGYKNGEWEEIVSEDHEGTGIVFFGEYNNKIYYANNEVFKYIDLNDKSLTPVTWIKCEGTYDTAGQPGNLVHPETGFVKDGIIYFRMQIGSHEHSLRYLSVDATKFSDIKKVANIGYSFDYNLDNNAIYYMDYKEIGTPKDVVKFDMKTKEKSKIHTFDKNTTLLSGHNGITLIAKSTKNKNKYNLYLYNLETSKETYLDEVNYTPEDDDSIWYNYYGTNRLIVDKNTIYYLDNNNVMKYENGNKSKVYEYNTDKNKNYFEGDYLIFNENDNNILYHRNDENDEDEYITFDGKKITESEFKETYQKYEIILKDKSKKTIYDEDGFGVEYNLNTSTPW